MGRVAMLVATTALVVVATAPAGETRLVSENGVGMRVAAGWVRVAPAANGVTGDPRTVLVVGTKGVVARTSECQVASYRIPADGAAVVILAWKGRASPAIANDRDVLLALRLQRPYFECWDGRGGSAQIAIRGRAYQVNVMVGDRASRSVVLEALTAARSFAATS